MSEPNLWRECHDGQFLQIGEDGGKDGRVLDATVADSLRQQQDLQDPYPLSVGWVNWLER